MIPAASLILVREATGGLPEFLMVERSAAMAFAPGAFVFPGGRVDPADALIEGCDAARVAAIRETLEETALAAGLTPVPAEQTARTMQRELLAGRSLPELLDGHRMTLDPEALTAFARWLPGPEVSRRFDTSFFIAKAPADCEPNLVGGECVSARWVPAMQMLEEEKAGAARLIYPTRKMLERLSMHASLGAILDEARSRPMVTVTPEVDGAFIRIPEGLGYPVTREPLDRVRRG